MNPALLARASSAQPYSNTGGNVLGRALQRSSAAPSAAAKAVENLVQPEVWTMYDTRLFSANAVAPDTAAFSFASMVNSLSFFAQRTIGNAGAAITSMTTNSGYVDFPFKAFGIGVDVWCDTDAASAAGIATAAAFVETIVNYGAIELRFATDLKFLSPISDLPSGGGVVYGAKVRTQASAANSDSCGANNGAQTAQARALWKDYILFNGQQTPFTCNLVLPGSASNGALARIQGLQALTSNFQAGIRIKFWGYRGKRLIVGAPYRG